MLHPQKEHGDRSNVPNIAVLISNGRATIDFWKTVPAAKSARTAGINIFVIGVGSQIDYNELEGIAGSKDHVKLVWNFGMLLEKTFLKSLYSNICSKFTLYWIYRSTCFERGRVA